MKRLVGIRLNYKKPRKSNSVALITIWFVLNRMIVSPSVCPVQQLNIYGGISRDDLLYVAVWFCMCFPLAFHVHLLCCVVEKSSNKNNNIHSSVFSRGPAQGVGQNSSSGGGGEERDVLRSEAESEGNRLA